LTALFRPSASRKIRYNNSTSLYIDGANPSFIKSLKLQIGEDPDYDKVIARYRSDGLGDSWTKDMKIVPVNFNKEHAGSLQDDTGK
jgi:hypothetical protein